MLREFVAMLGLSDHLAGIRTVSPSGGAIAQDPDSALGVLAHACRLSAETDGADTVILGGAGLAGLASCLAAEVPCPLICSVQAGTRAVLAATARGTHQIDGQTPVDSIGLAPALAAKLAAP
jgi:Asp/Glu/hydantoin racemase